MSVKRIEIDYSPDTHVVEEKFYEGMPITVVSRIPLPRYYPLHFYCKFSKQLLNMSDKEAMRAFEQVESTVERLGLNRYKFKGKGSPKGVYINEDECNIMLEAIAEENRRETEILRQRNKNK